MTGLDLNAPWPEGSLRQCGDLPHQLVLTPEPYPLRGCRGVKLEVRLHPTVLPGAPDGRLDGVEDGGGQEERRLSHGLAGVDRPGVGDASQEADVELGGDVIETGNFVGPRT